MYQKIFVALEEFGTIIASEGHGYSGLSALKNSGFVTKPPFYFFPFPNPKRTTFFFDLDLFRFFLFSDFIFVFFFFLRSSVARKYILQAVMKTLHL